jgi:hypothetical protein
MKRNMTPHAQVRAQQRGIPPLISDWLLGYGEEQFDGHGGVVRFFTKTGIRRLERDVGRGPVKRMSEYLKCYLVESSRDGGVITLGVRHANKRIYRH